MPCNPCVTRLDQSSRINQRPVAPCIGDQRAQKGSYRIHRMHRCDALLSSTKNAPDSLYRPGQPAVHPNRSQRTIFGRRPYPQCLRFSPQVISSTCGIDMCPPFQVKRHKAKPRLRTCHQVFYCSRLLLIHSSPRNLSAEQQANLNGQRHIVRHMSDNAGARPQPKNTVPYRRRP